MKKKSKVVFGEDSRSLEIEADLQEFNEVLGESNAFISNDCPMFWGFCENNLVYLTEKDYRVKNIEAYYGVKLTQEVKEKTTVLELVQWLRKNRTNLVKRDHNRIHWLGIKEAQYSSEQSIVTLHEIYEHTFKLLEYLEKNTDINEEKVKNLKFIIRKNSDALASADGYKIEMYDGRKFNFKSFEQVNDWIMIEAKKLLNN